MSSSVTVMLRVSDDRSVIKKSKSAGKQVTQTHKSGSEYDRSQFNVHLVLLSYTRIHRDWSSFFSREFLQASLSIPPNFV